MRRMVVMILVAIAVGISAMAQGQNTLALDFFQEVELRDAAKFEEGIKKHIVWRREHNDPWRWNTWQLVRGERLGQYLTTSGGHSWKDFDSMPLAREAQANYLSLVGAHLKSMAGTVSSLMPAFSRLPEEPLKNGDLAQVILYRVKQTKGAQFMEALGRFKEAADKVDWPMRYMWLSTALGGEPTMVLVILHENWAQFEPLEKTPQKVVEEAFGRNESVLLFERISEAIESVTTEAWVYREDLSYIPAP